MSDAAATQARTAQGGAAAINGTPGPEQEVAAAFSWRGVGLGMRLTLPIVPTIGCFAAGIGAAAAERGLSMLDSTLMTGFVFAGVAQIVAIQQWPRSFDVSIIVALLVSVAIVNARMVLLSASVRSWMLGQPRPVAWAIIAMISEPNWLIGMRYRAGGGQDAGVLLGSGLILWVVCLSMTIAGYVFGRIVENPGRYGLDLVTALMFAVITVNFWKSQADTLTWIVAGSAALLAWALIPGYWFVLAGALAGSVAAMYLQPVKADA